MTSYGLARTTLQSMLPWSRFTNSRFRCWKRQLPAYLHVLTSILRCLHTYTIHMQHSCTSPRLHTSTASWPTCLHGHTSQHGCNSASRCLDVQTSANITHLHLQDSASPRLDTFMHTSAIRQHDYKSPYLHIFLLRPPVGTHVYTSQPQSFLPTHVHTRPHTTCSHHCE
jgi:hypothetical protein